MLSTRVECAEPGGRIEDRSCGRKQCEAGKAIANCNTSETLTVMVSDQDSACAIASVARV
jgi:hypothetical protein